MSEFRLGGAEVATFIERVGDPGALANRGRVYTKDVAAVTNLFFQDSAGAVFNIGGPGLIDTLNEAYNGPGGAGSGRTITADNGAVAIVLSGATVANQALVITETGVARTTPMMALTRDALVVDAAAHVVSIANSGTLNNAIDIAQSGGGDAIAIVLGDAALTGQAFVVTEDNVARSTAMVVLTREANATGQVLTINNAGTNSAIGIAQIGVLNAVNIAQDGGGDALRVVLGDAALTGQALVVSEDDVIRTTSMVVLTRQANAIGRILQINNAGSGDALNIGQGGGADAINVSLADAALTGQALVVTEDDVIRTTSMISLTREANAIGICIDIANAGSGVGLNVSGTGGTIVTSGGVTIGGDLDHNGSNVGFYGTAPAAQSAGYTLNATIVIDRTLLASASATTLNNNNVLAGIITDLQSVGLLG